MEKYNFYRLKVVDIDDTKTIDSLVNSFNHEGGDIVPWGTVGSLIQAKGTVFLEDGSKKFEILGQEGGQPYDEYHDVTFASLSIRLENGKELDPDKFLGLKKAYCGFRCSGYATIGY
ncbi:hypothetical protein J5491_02745 [Candidatus Saccharibacteria bacterium]|nr:hypothetical protein [Candidatus Saccharibacteria bacterium]